PVPDHLESALAVDVRDRRQLAAELAAQSRLLLDLAKRAALERFARFELSLREGPVLAMRAMDEEDLPLAARCVPDDYPARSLDRPLVSLGHVPSMPHRWSGLQELRCPDRSGRHIRVTMAVPGRLRSEDWDLPHSRRGAVDEGAQRHP